ncbi:hypothetical protein H310_03039 [Aphanomyces invadans]|uniref:START domain-containing protein n=1 Tax=Aphanomyces invadans TaxID=157072 RepID=A0A024UMW4_9STRA|nr:hypothetical protein H310_03039 [Aphanomyces invadans]ETW06928.1 hypothetical protein H310_03039 [Aphanomyces invadans]|eukprot:XP_008865003.1 hypothetical protein H310_03039 [Aphanomyces invadans]
METDAAAAAKAKKREYNREKQRIFQAKLVQQMLSLRDEVAALEAQLAQLHMASSQRDDDMSGYALSWKDVAAGLEEDCKLVVDENRRLRRQRHGQRELLKTLQAWVNVQTRHATALTAPTHTWRNVTLLASPESRVVGFDWITAHLYHNTEAVFQRYAFPSVAPEEISGDFAIDSTDPDVMQYVWRYQKEMDMPMEFVVECFRDNVWRSMMLGGFVVLHTEVLDNMPEKMIYRHTITSPDETVNYLGREYADGPDRVVFVGQNIHDDAIVPSGSRQRNRMAWVVLDRLTPCHTRVRILHLNSHFFTKDGYVSLDDEARFWGGDVSDAGDEHTKFVKFQRHVTVMGDDVARLCRNKFEGACYRQLKHDEDATPLAFNPCIACDAPHLVV